MCGIGGILRVTPPGEAAAAMGRDPREVIPEAWLDIIDESIKHRGPDGAGRFRDRAVRADGSVVDIALVHRRLSILDHEGGHQPMVSLGRGRGVVTGVKTLSLGPGLGLYEPGGVDRLSVADVAAASTRRTRSASEASHPVRPPRPLAAPTTDHPGLVAVIFNGCIYNHRELRKELEGAGHEFSTDHSDTEVLVHGWREWGEELFSRLEGMFAIGVWDRARTSLVLARDRHGEKPLSIHRQRHGQVVTRAFSSVPSGLVRLYMQWKRDTDHKGAVAHAYSLDHWIAFGYGAWPDHLPFSVDIDDLMPGEPALLSLDYTDKATIAERKPMTIPVAPDRSPEPLTPELVDELIGRAVASRLEADVSLGVFLSGGVDSSLIAAKAARARGSVDTFCVRMPLPEYDESGFAEAAARTIGARHQTLSCEANPSEDLIALIEQLGLPFGDSSLLPAYWVSRAARGHVRVALSGDGGDELFCGYERYQGVKTLYRYRRLLRLLPPGLWSQRNPKSISSKMARLQMAARGDGYADIIRIFSATMVATLVGHKVHNIITEKLDPLFKHRPVFGAVFSDRASYLPGDLLRKTDTASMAVALEVRCPYLDTALWSAVACRAPTTLMPHGQRKGLLRQVARKYFPPEIVDRPKMGFAIPVGEWFRSNYGGMRDLLYDHLESAEPFGPPSLGIELNMDFIRRMLREHDDAGGESMWPWKGRDHSQRLYMLLVLSIWAKWLGGVTGRGGLNTG